MLLDREGVETVILRHRSTSGYP